MKKEEFNTISKEILDASITVHKAMGPGLLESVYEYCLAFVNDFLINRRDI